MKKSFLLSLVLTCGILLSASKVATMNVNNLAKGTLSSGLVLYGLYNLYTRKINEIPEKEEPYDCGQTGCEVLHSRIYPKQLIEVEPGKKTIGYTSIVTGLGLFAIFLYQSLKK